MPAIAAAIPTACAAPGRSPRAIPAMIGTTTPVALIGATMLIVPTTIAWKNAARADHQTQAGPRCCRERGHAGRRLAADHHPGAGEHQPDQLGGKQELDRADPSRRRAAEEIARPAGQ